MSQSTTYPQYYGQRWPAKVAGRAPAKPYVAIRQRIGLPFFTAPQPAPAAPSIPVEFAAAFASLLKMYQWIESYTRKTGVIVRAHLRRKAVA